MAHACPEWYLTLDLSLQPECPQVEGVSCLLFQARCESLAFAVAQDEKRPTQ